MEKKTPKRLYTWQYNTNIRQSFPCPQVTTVSKNKNVTFNYIYF